MTKDTDQEIGQNMRRDFYVYAWLRPCGTPFYVGKGRGKRAKDKRRNTLFSKIFEKIKSSGATPVMQKIAENLTEREAFDLEVLLIAKYGRIDQCTGSLANLTDGGEGTSGHVKSKESIAKTAAAHKGKVITQEHRDIISFENRMRPPKGGRFKGVSFDASSGSWRMSFAVKDYGRRKESYRSEIAAAKAYDAAARSIWGNDCYLNFPDEFDPNSEGKVTRWTAKSKSAPKSKPFKGVYFHIRCNKWTAKIKANGVDKFLGYYHSETDAALAYDKEAFKAFGAGCYLNFPDMISSPAPRRMTLSEAKRFEPPRKGDFKGVNFDKAAKRWKSGIRVDGKMKHLIMSTDPIVCAIAYDRAAVAAWGLGNCYLNFPDQFDKLVEQEAA